MLKLAQNAQNIAFGYRVYAQGQKQKHNTALVDIAGGLGDWIAKPVTNNDVISSLDILQQARANYNIAIHRIMSKSIDNKISQAEKERDLIEILNVVEGELSAKQALSKAMCLAGMNPQKAVFITKDAPNIENLEPFKEAPVWVVTDDQGIPNNNIAINPTNL